MNLKVLLTILLLISIPNFEYSQSIRKIGNDTLVVLTLKEGEIMNKNFTLMRDSINYLKSKIDTVKFDYDKYLKINETRIKNMHDSFFQYYRNNDLKVLKMDSLNYQIKLYRHENHRINAFSWLTTGLIYFLTFILITQKPS